MTCPGKTGTALARKSRKPGLYRVFHASTDTPQRGNEAGEQFPACK